MSERGVLKVTLNPTVKTKVKLMAAGNGQSITNYVTELIEKDLEQHPEVRTLQEELQVKKEIGRLSEKEKGEKEAH